MKGQEIARLVSIPEVARRVGVSRHTARIRLQRLHQEHPGDWLVSQGPRRKLFVNLSALLAAHPDWAERRPPSSDDIDELLDRVAELEESMRAARSRIGACLSRVRQLEAHRAIAPSEPNGIERDRP